MGAIIAINLGKAYKQYPTRWARLAEWITPGKKTRHKLHWILQDINFNIKPGEAVGLIGINGAGKSTLLKMITGTTRPTTGNVHTTGRVAALLELGMGFHPDFTGRQNAYMAGQLLGYSVEEINRLMPEIEAFAEIGDYIDQPVRVYSSGMQVRLAFSVATAVRPDILIVDEALSVGDIFFQQKCYQRIQQFLTAGTTLLFVTHGMGTVLELCSRAIYLRAGRIEFDGVPREAIDLYQADLLVTQDQGADEVSLAKPSAASSSVESKGSPGSLQTDSVTCVAVRMFDRQGKEISVLLSEDHIRLDIIYRIHRHLQDPHVGFKIRTQTGVVVFETNTYCMGQSLGPAGPHSELNVSFDFPVDLSPGDYTITIGLANEGTEKAQGVFRESLSYLHGVLAFKVLPNPSSIIWAGVVNIHPVVGWRQSPVRP